MWVQVSETVTPKSWVMRLETSTLMSTWFADGLSAVLNQSTVGIDISSATQGSSVTRVAGKKRAPTKQCASTTDTGRGPNMSTAAAIATTTAKRNVLIFIVPAPEP